MEAVGFERRILERYSTKEKDILLNLIRSKAAILENKSPSYPVVISKKIAWQEIADEFNSYDEFKDRTPAQLKKWWENEKARRKKLRAAYSLRASAKGVKPLPSGEPIAKEMEFILVPSFNYFVEDAVNCDQDRVVPPNVVEENCALPSPGGEVNPALSVHSPSVPEVSLPWDSPKAPQTTAVTSPFTTSDPPLDKVSHSIAGEELKQRLKRISAVPSQDDVLYRLRYREQRCILQAARLKCATLIADKEHKERLNRKEMEAAEEAILHKRQLHDQLMLQKSELHEQLMLQQKKEHILRMKLLRIKCLNS